MKDEHRKHKTDGTPCWCNSKIVSYKKKKRIRAWADIGSHRGIFCFQTGPVAEKYPTLMHIYYKKVSKDLKPIIIEF